MFSETTLLKLQLLLDVTSSPHIATYVPKVRTVLIFKANHSLVGKDSLFTFQSASRSVKEKHDFTMGMCHRIRMKEGRGVHKVLVGKPEGKRPLGRPRRRWEDNTKMDLEEVGRSCGDWMELAQDRKRWQTLVSTVMNLRVP